MDIYANVKTVEALDPFTVVFKLKEPNPEFPLDVGDYHSVIVSADVKSPGKDFIGTGPFIADSYLPEDRIVLKRNPNYWMSDEKNEIQLPYLDGLEILSTADTQAQVKRTEGDRDVSSAAPREGVLFENSPPKLQEG